MDKFLPGRHQIMSFGNGGFRFADMSHQGSLLVLPDRMCAWAPVEYNSLVPTDLDPVIAERANIDLLLIGTGKYVQPLATPTTNRLRDHLIAFEVMSTSSAVHVYNVVLTEGRRVAAAMLVVP